MSNNQIDGEEFHPGRLETTMLRYNTGKPKLALLPLSFYEYTRLILPTKAFEDTAKVLTFGASKYALNQWRAGGSWLAVCDSALRHVFAIERGEQNDTESGLPHIAHVLCNIAFLIEFEVRGTKGDDRMVIDNTNFEASSGLVSLLLAYAEGASTDTLLDICTLIAKDFYHDAN